MSVSILNINNNIKEFIRGFQHCSIIQILIFDAYVKVRKSLYI